MRIGSSTVCSALVGCWVAARSSAGGGAAEDDLRLPAAVDRGLLEAIVLPTSFSGSLKDTCVSAAGPEDIFTRVVFLVRETLLMRWIQGGSIISMTSGLLRMDSMKKI